MAASSPTQIAETADTLTLYVSTADTYADGLIHVTIDDPADGVLQELTLPPRLAAELVRQLTAATAPEASPADPIFYTLPATALEEGMSTDDGQDVVDVAVQKDGTVFASVYTRRSDDAELDADNREQTETRIYGPGERVGLAVFGDTTTDGSELPDALPGTLTT